MTLGRIRDAIREAERAFWHGPPDDPDPPAPALLATLALALAALAAFLFFATR